MCVCVTIKERPYHALILRAMEARLSFEEIDASLRERNRHLLRVLSKYQLTGRREKVLNNTQTPKRFIGVLYWLFHKCVDPASNTLHRKYE
jgi:hypothetical protein